ncbi:hypothetical protein L7F22_039826 [Adiantum nelumboides]|nr:hypothetical protein [Adiantum nelumboides]
MQTATGMLLRSSSTPLLDHYLLAAPFCHTEPFLDTRNEGIMAAGDGQSPLCAFLHTSRGGGPHLPPSSHLPIHVDFHMKFSGWPSRSDSPVGPPSANLMRKAQSENDLCSLGGGGSLTPARVAANTLLQDSLVDDCASGPGSVFESYNPSCYLPPMKKGRALLPLSRRRSLGSLPSELPSVFFNSEPGDGDFAILEEGELSPSLSSVASEVDDDRQTQACVSDKVALAVNETVLSNHDDGVLLNNLHFQSKSYSGIPEKNVMQAMASGQRVGMPRTGYDKADMVASPSGRQELGVEPRQSQYANLLSRNDMVLTLTREVCGPISSSHYVYDEDKLDGDCNGGDGGRGARPRFTVSGGGGGGGGDAGGRGGGSPEVDDQHYRLMLQKDPGNPLFLCNYAQYLADVKHDYRKAEEFFQRAILASPSDGELLGRYAKMLWEVKHDTERAADYFERAVQAAPDNSYVMAAYASFLWSLEEEQDTTDFPTSFPSLVSAGLA